MLTKEYIFAICVITFATMTMGFFLWDGGTQQLSLTTNSTACEGWCRGAEDAPVIIDTYPDFECHICVEKELLLVQALDIYPDEIRVDYHHYPSSDYSYKLAEALEAAGEQGKFWDMHDLLIQDPPDYRSELDAMVIAVGLDADRFNDSFDSRKFYGTVHSDKEKAISEGVNYVSVFINGMEYEKYPGTLADLCSAIDAELERMEANGGN